MADDEPYANIRELLGVFVGCTLVDVTQHDEEDFLETGESRIYLHFNNGATLSFPIGEEGFATEFMGEDESGEPPGNQD